MVVTISYPIILITVWTFVLGFAVGALIFGLLFYRERKRLLYTIKTSSEITARMSAICDDLIERISELHKKALDKRTK